MLDVSLKGKTISIDVETKGLDWTDPAQGVFGVALAFDAVSYYWDVREAPEVLPWLQEQAHLSERIVNHNIKFDIHMLRTAGCRLPVDKCECTSIRAALIDEHLPSMSLDSVAFRYLGKKKVDDIYPKLAEMFRGNPDRKTQIKNLFRAPTKMVAEYAKVDAELALALWRWQEAEIIKQNLTQVWQLEKTLFPVTIDMETRGLRIDVARAEASVEKITSLFNERKEQLTRIAGQEINHNPSGDIAKLFEPKQNEQGEWVLIDGTVADVTPAGKASIGSSVLKRMTHPAAKLILDCRKLSKTRDTFLLGHVLGNVNKRTGLVHPNINQVVTGSGFFSEASEGTRTGRFSMTRPALQQIPARDKEIAAIMRPLFLPDEDHEWFSVDYRQFEFRVFAHYVKSPEIDAMYHANPDMDFHQLVADIAGIPRNAPEAGGANAKQVNLGVIMGMGEGKMAKEMMMPHTITYVIKLGRVVLADVFSSRSAAVAHLQELCKFKEAYKKAQVVERLHAGDEAKEVIAKYHEAIPGVKLMSKRAEERGRTRGYIFTLGKRRIRYPDKSEAYKAASNIYQGGAADCLKQKLIECDKILREHGDGRILLAVHDEINFSIPKGAEDLKRKLLECMETFDGIKCPLFLRIPVRTEAGSGENWAQASGKGV